MGDNSIKPGSSRSLSSSSSSLFFFRPGFLCLIVTLVTVSSQIDGTAAAKLSACNLNPTFDIDSFDSNEYSNEYSDSVISNTTCDCTDSKGKQDPMVSCVKIKGMTEVPKDILLNTHILVIKYADIDRLYPDDFAGLDNLVGLNLDYLPKLTTIESRPFRNLYKLKYLFLQYNGLTNLDPNWKTFRFLTSLTTLDVSGNRGITTVHKNSFLTNVYASKGTFKVYLRRCKINCDCSVVALRRWVTDIDIELVDMICYNDPNKRFYDNIPLKEYPLRCRAKKTTDEVVTCQTCEALMTNHDCSRLPSHTCSKDQRCQRTVSFRNETGIRIHSKCVDQDACSTMAYRNKDTCMTGSRLSRVPVECNYCCTDDVCGTKSEMDRTNDYTYKLTLHKNYTNVPQALFDNTSDTYKQEVSELKSHFAKAMGNFYGGWTINVNRSIFNPVNEKTVEAEVIMDLTVFNWVKAKDVIAYFNGSLPGYFGSHHYTPVNGSIVVITAMCPTEKMVFKGNTFTWPETDVGVKAGHRCSGSKTFAYRTCIMVDQDEVRWGEVDVSGCVEKASGADSTYSMIMSAHIVVQCLTMFCLVLFRF